MALLVETLESPTATQAGSVAPTGLHNMSMYIAKWSIVGALHRQRTCSHQCVPRRSDPLARVSVCRGWSPVGRIACLAASFSLPCSSRWLGCVTCVSLGLRQEEARG